MLGVIGTFSVIFAMDHYLYADSSVQGGTITAAVGPVGGSMFRKGDRIITDISYAGNEITWLLINDSTKWAGGAFPDGVTAHNFGMYALSYDSITTSAYRYTLATGVGDDYNANPLYSDLNLLYKDINTNIDNNTTQKRYIMEHSPEPNTINPQSSVQPVNAAYKKLSEDPVLKIVLKYTFPQQYNEISTKEWSIPSRFGNLENNDRIYGSDPDTAIPYLSGNINSNGTLTDAGKYVNNIGHFTEFADNAEGVMYWDDEMAVRVPILFDMSDVVFAASEPTLSASGNGMYEVNRIENLTTYTSLYEEAGKYPSMKLRLKDDVNLGVTFDSITTASQIPQTGDSIEIYEGSGITVNWSGKKNATGNDMVSIFVEKKLADGSYELLYYVPISSQEQGSFAVDTSQYAIGEYRISLVNETITNTNAATFSSSFASKTVTIAEAVEPEITYQNTNHSGKYDFNTEATLGSTIGEITVVKGALPLIYKLTGNGDDSYKNLEIAGLDANGTSVSPNLDLKIKQNAVDQTNGNLAVGTYKFCIEVQDSRGFPATPTDTSRVCSSFQVTKTIPTFSFKNSDTTNIKIGGASIYEEFETNNPEITGSDAAHSAKYEISGGVDGTGLKVEKDAANAKGYNISIGATSNASLPATFQLEVTLPETENYASVTKIKNIYVFKGLSNLIWTPTKAGDYSIADGEVGKTVGSLLAKDGLASYTYALTTSTDTGYIAEKASDNNKFIIENGTSLAANVSANVKTRTALSANTYHIQFKVTDGNSDTFYKDAVIVVSANGQAELAFMENGAKITSKTLYYDDTNILLKAEGGEESISALPTYAFATNQPASITADEYVSILDNGNGTATIQPRKITETNKPIRITATKEGNAQFSSVSTDLLVTILPAKQSIAFDNTNDPRNIRLNETDVFEKAQGILTSNGTKGSGKGGIVYSSANTDTVGIDEVTGTITPKRAGNVEIMATLNKQGSAGYDANYESATITKRLHIYEGMQIDFHASDPKLTASGTAVANATAGTLTVQNNTGLVEYAKVEDESVADNIDAKYFIVDALGNIKLTDGITANDLHTHGNPYKLQVKVNDTIETQIINIVIQFDQAENDFYFIDPVGLQRITKVEKTYVQDGTFQLKTHTSNSGSVSYKIKDGENTTSIDVSTSGLVKIKKVGGPITIEATVAQGSGYAEKTITIPVTIQKGTYQFAWDHPDTTYVRFTNGASVEEKASLTPAGALHYEVLPASTSICSIDVSGTITALQEGTCEIKATSTNSNFNEITGTKRVVFFVGAQGIFTQDNIPTAGLAPVGTTIGRASVQSENDTSDYKYSIQTETSSENADKDLIQVDPDYGTVSLKTEILAQTLQAKSYDASKGGYILKFVVQAIDPVTNDVTTIKCEAVIKGAKMNNVSFKGEDGLATNKITKVYQRNGTFTLSLLNNAGGTPVYSFKSGPEDVIDPTINGNTVSILHANEKHVLSNVVIQAVIPAKNGYEPTTITCVVEILQAEQINFRFRDARLQMMPNSSVEPQFEGMETIGPITLKSDDKSVVFIEQDGLTISSKDKEASTTITATNKGDRDFKDGIATMDVEVSNTPAYPFEIDVEDAMYGDENIEAIVTNSEPTVGAEISRKWTSSHPEIASIDEHTGEITIKKAGSTTITCLQTSSIDPDVRDSIVFNVAPKPIEIRLDDQTKLVGEEVPEFTAQIPVDELVGDDTLSLPVFTCVDENGNLVDKATPVGTYDILGSYDIQQYPNYRITFQNAKLHILQDTSSEAWYQLIGKQSGEQLQPDTWVKEPILVTLMKDESAPYDQISFNQSDWENDAILIEQEGSLQSDIYFQKQATHALASKQDTSVKIDMTKPIIQSISGEAIEQNAISKLLNNLTFGAYFKPEDQITIHAKDLQPTGVNEISGLKEVHYEIHEIDKSTGLPKDEVYDEATLTMDLDAISFHVEDIGAYRICANAIDQAENASTISCADIHVKEIDVDKDDDGIPDFNDPDGDGCPDLNIVLGSDAQGNAIKLNVAEQGETYPYMNIDSNGDGKADLNIDTDHDNKPDLNLVHPNQLKDAWSPKKCVSAASLQAYSKPIEYCTGTSIQAEINIDLQEDRIPDVNIDTNGDWKADFNIAKKKASGKGFEEPYLNVGMVHTPWKPEQDFTYQKFLYDTSKECDAIFNIDTDDDGYPDINIDLNGDKKPDLNIDVDGDRIPDTNIDITGDGNPDINLDPEKTGTPQSNIYKLKEWLPEKNGTKDGMSFDTMVMDGLYELEDQNISVVPKDENHMFLPNYALKVKDVTEEKKEEIITESETVIDKTQEIKAVFDVRLLADDVEVEPNGILKVRIPIPEGIQNPKVLVKRNGSYQVFDVEIDNGYLIYESDALGIISIIADKEKEVTNPEPDPIIKNEDPSSTPTVKGNYTSVTGIGGAQTGNQDAAPRYALFVAMSGALLARLFHRKRT